MSQPSPSKPWYDFADKAEYKATFLADFKPMSEYASEFPDAFNRALDELTLVNPRFSGMRDDFEKLTPEQIHAFCHRFWASLPDNPSIRHGWFGRLCDYCSEWRCWGER